MVSLLLFILALVLGFCAGSMRSLETPEVNRLTKLYWDSQAELDETNEEKKQLKGELTKVKLELTKLKKENSK